MKTHTQPKTSKKIDENDFSQLDAWARGLKLEDGRPLSPRQQREHQRAKRVGPGRPAKAPGQKAERYMVSMNPALHNAAVQFSRSAKVSLSGLIADALARRIDFKPR
jgi:hypothetical protein